MQRTYLDFVAEILSLALALELGLAHVRVQLGTFAKINFLQKWETF